MARVELVNLCKYYRGASKEEVRAVDGISLAVEEKELLVLVGPSGSGKSTILRLIAGLEDASQGTILIDGQVVNKVPPQDRNIAMVFQNFALYPHMSVFDNLAFPLKLRKFSKAEIRKRVNDTAELLGLTPYFDRFPRALSGGQRQRVALGRAIVQQPRVFLLDEPLSNLDAPMRLQMRIEIAKLHDRLGATMIYVTHDQMEAMAIGHRIAVADQGRIHQAADPLTLYHRPANLFVAGFLGSPPMNFIRGTLEGHTGGVHFRAGPAEASGPPDSFSFNIPLNQAGRLKSYVGKTVVFGLRSEDISCCQPNTIDAPNTFIEASVVRAEPLGAETHVHLAVGGHLLVARLGAEVSASPNQKTWVKINVSKGHFFDAGTGLTIC